MNKFKKLLGAVLACAMVFSAVGTASVSAALPPDMEDSRYAEAVETLGALNIMVGDAETGLFRPNEPIKRSEFAKIAVNALGLADVAESSNYPTKYPDVVADHWANGYINVATNQKLVIGDDTGTFRPDDTITYAEAMTILVRVIGHEPSAISKGGYPAGYLVVGTENNLNRNASASSEDPATRAMVAQMTFNSLTVNMMEQTGFGDSPEYTVVDKTLLTDKLHTQKIKGQVVATSQTKLEGSGALKKGEVQVGDSIYKLADGVSATNLLGYNVVFYLQEDDHGDEYVILIRPEESKNSSLTITADNIENVEDGDARKVLSYWKDKENDKRVSEAYISNDAKLVYNGKTETLDNATINLNGKAGKVNLLDTDRDNKYDLVFVTEYKNVVVEEVMPSTGKIIDKYGAPTIALDPDNDDLDYTIEKAGELINVEDLQEWDVLSVAESKDKSIYRIIVVRETVEGKVTEIRNDEIKINDTLYKVANNYTDDIALEDEGTFYLDVEGKIAAVDATSTISSNYAYLVNAAMQGGVSDSLELRLFTKDGETVVLTVADKVRLNGESGKTAADALKLLAPSSTVVNQLITYDQNSDGKVVSINTAKDNTSTGKIEPDSFTKNKVLSDAVYKSATGKLGDINVGKDTIIFDIPETSTNPEDFAIRDYTMFEDETPYDAVVFDLEEDYTAKVMIVTSTDYQANAESSVAIVTSITSIKNDQGVVVDKLYAMQDGQKVELLTAEKGLLVKSTDDGYRAGTTPLVKGDIIQYKTNTKGEISTIRVLFDTAKKDEMFKNDSVTDMTILYGQVTAKFPSSMNITVDGDTEQNISFGNAKIYLLDPAKSSNIVTEGTTGDIQKYDESDPYQVFVKIYKDVVQEIIVVKL